MAHPWRSFSFGKQSPQFKRRGEIVRPNGETEEEEEERAPRHGPGSKCPVEFCQSCLRMDESQDPDGLNG